MTLTPGGGGCGGGGVGAVATALRVFVSHVAEESMYQFRIVGGPHCRELGVQPGTMWTVAGVADTGADLKRLIKVRALCGCTQRSQGSQAHRLIVPLLHAHLHTLMQHKFKTGEADLHILYNGLAVTDEDEMQTLDIDGETCTLCVCCDRDIDSQSDKRTDACACL